MQIPAEPKLLKMVGCWLPVTKWLERTQEDVDWIRSEVARLQNGGYSAQVVHNEDRTQMCLYRRVTVADVTQSDRILDFDRWIKLIRESSLKY